MFDVKAQEYATGWKVLINGKDGNWSTSATIPAPNERAADAMVLKIVDAINEHSSDRAQVGCVHDWANGYSMNGPTRTCKLCGKFERD